MTTCDHNWERVREKTPFLELIVVPKRICTRCKSVQYWRQRATPTPENAPHLGEWEDVDEA